MKGNIHRYFTKNGFIKLVEKYAENDLEDKDFLKAKESKGIGADGLLIALTIIWIRRGMKGKSYRNKRSDRKLVSYLKSEMRWYADEGSFSPIVGDIVQRYLTVKCEEIKKKEK